MAFWQRGCGTHRGGFLPAGRGVFLNFSRPGPRRATSEQTLVRWLLPEAPPPGVGVRARVVGSDLLIELLHDTELDAAVGRTASAAAAFLRLFGKAYEVPLGRKSNRAVTRYERQSPRADGSVGLCRRGKSAGRLARFPPELIRNGPSRQSGYRNCAT